MKKKITLLLIYLIINISVTAQTMPSIEGQNLLKDGTGNIINLTTGNVYKDLGDGTVIDLNSGDIFKKIDDGTIIKLESDIKVPIIK